MADASKTHVPGNGDVEVLGHIITKGAGLCRWSNVMINRYALRIVVLAALLTFGVQARAQDIDSNDSEYLIKAGFIYNFAKLVDWPQSAFGQAGQPIVIGVLGSDSFASILDHIVDGKKIDGRPLLVKRT